MLTGADIKLPCFAFVFACLVLACAELPKGQYGVERIKFEGIEQLDEETLKVCLATHEREAVVLGLSALREPTCGVPPFDRSRASVKLWSWGWTDWPVYDEAILKLDVKRIERWYQARGYYRAHVEAVRFDPPAVANDTPCKEDCEARITIEVTEGEPTRLRSVKLVGHEKLPEDLKEELEEALELKKGDIFDEATYAAAQERIHGVFRETGYARAVVKGDVAVHRGLLYADMAINVEPGPLCTLGPVRIKSSSKIPEDVVLSVTNLKRGDTYHESDLNSAQHAIYGMGAFASVNVRGDFSGEGPEIPIVVEVSTRRESEPMIGAGLMSGVLSTGPLSTENLSVPQWDVHLLGSYNNRNFFGGLRQWRIEERPRLIFLDAFPATPANSPRFGNYIASRFAQPGVMEPRTTLFLENSWDYGPDPFLLFFRHDVANAIGLERAFYEGHITLRVAAHFEFMQRIPIGRQPDYIKNAKTPEVEPGEEPKRSLRDQMPSSYRLPYLEQRVTVDLRDDATQPTKGAFFAMGVHEALPLTDRSWTYFRFTPDARVYAPLGLGFVLAARFALGSIHILKAGDGFGRDIDSERLGPQAYRLRGGGANSNRGVLAGQLGEGLVGGIRRWEGSLELRIPVAKNFSIVGFGDVGDVNDNKNFRFGHLNTAVGGGMRYRTIVGPIRLDVGYRPRAIQRADGSRVPASEEPDEMNIGKGFRGAVHLTIGESF